jgi:hypothetical protein
MQYTYFLNTFFGNFNLFMAILMYRIYKPDTLVFHLIQIVLTFLAKINAEHEQKYSTK